MEEPAEVHIADRFGVDDEFVGRGARVGVTLIEPTDYLVESFRAHEVVQRGEHHDADVV